MTQPKPQRVELLDALRGFALIGVLLVNLRYFSLYALLPDAGKADLVTAGADRWLALLFAALVDTKSITLFTFLFGIGFALQFDEARRDGASTRRYLRRLAVLLGIGLVHGMVVWSGDILRYYAFAGLLLVACARLSTRTLLVLGTAIALFGSALLRPIMMALPRTPGASDAATAAALDAFLHGGVAEVVAANYTYATFELVANWSLVPFVLGRVLIGVAIGRSGVLTHAASRLDVWRRLWWWSLAVGGVLTAFTISRDAGLLPGEPAFWRHDGVRALTGAVRAGGSIAVACAWMAGFVLLYHRDGWQRRFAAFAAVGRTALSNYLAQTVIGISLFYGVGLGIGPRYGLLAVVFATVAIFALQCVLSAWWLARFRFGPVEWVWRCLTYGEWLGIRRVVVATG
ncbi:MAG TPA: DUF418 domain-containing protein [Tahibacter sp.]|nr:DUF418 domain-containing protein [Tahibacter sp.]